VRELAQYAATHDPLHRLKVTPLYVDNEVMQTRQMVDWQAGKIFIVEYNCAFVGLIAGFVAGQSDAATLSVVEGKTGVISNVYVAEENPSSGVGGAMMGHGDTNAPGKPGAFLKLL